MPGAEKEVEALYLLAGGRGSCSSFCFSLLLRMSEELISLMEISTSLASSLRPLLPKFKRRIEFTKPTVIGTISGSVTCRGWPPPGQAHARLRRRPILHSSFYATYTNTLTSTFTTVADNQQTVQFPVYQGERVNCEDNTSLGEFTLAPIPPMKAGEAVLEVVFEVDVNGILKVTATEKTSGRSANITISNSVGKLSSTEIESMINGAFLYILGVFVERVLTKTIADAAKYKSKDEEFGKRFETKQQLESYISRVEEMISDPTTSLKLKRGQKEKIETALSEAMAQLEIEDADADDLKKKELALKRIVTRAFATR